MPERRRRPSASSIIPASPIRSAKSTTAPRPWTGWSRSRSAASRSRLPRPPRSGTTSASTSSIRPATSTSPSKSSVQPARARRRGLRARRQPGRRAADGNRLASGRQVRRAAHRVRQQDGQDRRRLLPLRRRDQHQGRRPSGLHPAADRLRVELQGRHRSSAHEGGRLGRRGSRREISRRRDSGRPQGEGGRISPHADRGRGRAGRRRDERPISTATSPTSTR